MNKRKDHKTNRRSENGMALPATLFMLLVLGSVTAMLANISQENFHQIKVQEGTAMTNMTAEGALNRMIADMALYSSLWDQQAAIADKPAGYTEYQPAAYSSTNGIPPCSVSAACHRDMFPSGGGLIKNLGPLLGDGANAETSYSIVEQLAYDNQPEPDVTLSGLNGWSQLERLDEETPGPDSVGGNLSSGLAEGGNAKKVRFRITGYSLKSLDQRVGKSTVVAVVLLPVS